MKVIGKTVKKMDMEDNFIKEGIYMKEILKIIFHVEKVNFGIKKSFQIFVINKTEGILFDKTNFFLFNFSIINYLTFFEFIDFNNQN